MRPLRRNERKKDRLWQMSTLVLQLTYVRLGAVVAWRALTEMVTQADIVSEQPNSHYGAGLNSDQLPNTSDAFHGQVIRKSL